MLRCTIILYIVYIRCTIVYLDVWTIQGLKVWAATPLYHSINHSHRSHQSSLHCPAYCLQLQIVPCHESLYGMHRPHPFHRTHLCYYNHYCCSCCCCHCCLTCLRLSSVHCYCYCYCCYCCYYYCYYCRF